MRCSRRSDTPGRAWPSYLSSDRVTGVAAIVFTDAAIDDLRRLGPSVAPRVLKKILLLEQNAYAGHPLAKDLATYRKLIVGDNTWRVVYRVDDSGAAVICEIWAAGDAPIVAATTAPNAVPSWLAERLVMTARVDQALVAAMTQEEAVDAWTAFMMRPNP